MSPQAEIDIDRTTNSILLQDVGIYLEAYDNRILVVSDPFKSGYECKTCKETGRVPSTTVLGAMKECPDCNGKGQLLILPEIAKTLPTSGIILSMGPNCKILNRAQHFGQRVLVGPYTGTGVPIKGQIRIRSLREDEIVCFLWGEQVEDKDFIDLTPDIKDVI